ncbi:MAG: hypothetical protein AB1523_00415 [Bacillota bacterium]
MYSTSGEGGDLCGICGFTTRVTAVKGAGKGREIEVEVRLDSECPSWQKAAEEIASLKPFQELFSLPHEGRLYRVAARYVRHPACPVPAGILKALEVAAGLALPKDAVIKVTADS